MRLDCPDFDPVVLVIAFVIIIAAALWGREQ